MKKTILIQAAVAAFAMTVAGCASKANYSGDIQDEVVADAVVAESGIVDPSQEPSFGDSPAEPEGVGGGLLDRRRIHFEFDKSAIADEYLSLIAAHSDHLNRNPSHRVILEGHADERGSNEYNLALGQRRADAVRDIMLANGVGAGQIETLSFGEESPVAFGQNEADWAMNRRVQIRYYNE